MKFSIDQIAIALLYLGSVFLLGGMIRRYTPWLRAFFVPVSVVAGFVGLFIGPQVLGQLVPEGHWLENGLLPADTLDIWALLPGLLINVVFATILLGKKLPSLGVIWYRSAPQVLFGYTLSFGQYALGLLLAVTVLVPLFDLSPLVGGLLEISFTGGHGTAAGLTSTFDELGFKEGVDLALGLATIGLVTGIVSGTWLINRAVRSQKMTIARQEPTQAKDDYDIDKIDRYDSPEPEEMDSSTSPLTVHLALIGLAIILGWLVQQGATWFERLLIGDRAGIEIVSHIPLFPFTIIGGALLQKILHYRKLDWVLKRKLINQVSGTALDVLIVTAIATMSLSVLGDNWAPLLLMSFVAIAWSVFAFSFIAPRVFPHRWFEHGMGDFGQSAGTVATGFLLINMSDPNDQTGATESYGYKQLLFEPMVGGGLVTAVSLPLIAAFGPVTMGFAAFILTLIFVGTGMLIRKRATKA